MKAAFLPVAVMSLLLSLPASAEVALTLGTCLQAHVVNGEERAAGAGDTLSMANGTQQLVVDCTANLGRSDDDTFPETSDVFVLLFKASDTRLELLAPAMQSRRDMQAFNRTKRFRLVTDAGTPVQYQVDVLEKEGFQVFRDYRRELATFNRTESPAALLTRLPGTTATGTNSSTPAPQAGGQGHSDQETVRQMLRYWYLQADTETRNEWKNWIESSQ